MSAIQEWLKKTTKTKHGHNATRPRIKLASGLSMSVQAGYCIYSTPRDDNKGPWNTVEVGFPSERIDLLMKYADDPEEPTETVYGYVPVEIVDQIISENGGMINE